MKIFLNKFSCVVVLFLLFCSCKTEYASVYVNVKDKATQTSVGLDVYSATDNQYLCLSPKIITLTKKSNRAAPLLSLIVKDETGTYPLTWTLVKITHWADTQVLSMDALNLNQVVVYVKK